MNEFIFKKTGSFFLAIMLASMFVGVVSGETCAIKNIQISASKTSMIAEGEQITITVDFDYQRGAMEGTKIDWQVKIWEDDLVGDELMGTQSGSFPDGGPQNEHGTATFTVTPSDYVSIPEGCVIEVYANVQAGWEVGCIHNANSNTIYITVCDACPSCIEYEAFVGGFICSKYPEDACEIYANSLWYGLGVDISRDSDSRLADKTRNSHLWGSQSFKDNVNSKVKNHLKQKVEEIECKPVDECQDVEIFKDNNKVITSDEFSILDDPELYWIFKKFKVFPHGINQITLKRVGENDYKASGTIKVRLNDRFDFHEPDLFAYECQQAGCVHNFDIDVNGIDFVIHDLEITIDSSKMHCDGDPEKIQCCPEGCINKAELSASLSADSPVNSGSTFNVKMTVSNAADSATANNVAPSSLSVNTLTGDASVSSCGGHSPTSANIPGGSSQDFTWTCTASGEGTLKLSASASGTDACSGETVTASSTTSNTVTVEVPEFLFGLVLPLMSSVLIYFTMRGRIKKR
jgi:hypothetical protein